MVGQFVARPWPVQPTRKVYLVSGLGFVIRPTESDGPGRDNNDNGGTWPTAGKAAQARPIVVNTRNSLWPERWPAIALEECIDIVESAPPEEQEAVKYALPCRTCPAAHGCLNAKRKEIGSLMYDREIQSSPRSEESTMFPLTLMQPMLDELSEQVPHYRKPPGLEDELRVVQAWDLAWSEKTGGDWLVCMTAVVNVRSGRRTLLEIQRWQRKTFAQQIEMIKQRHAAYQSDLVVIEGDAAQQIWKQQISADTSVPVVQHNASDGKQSLRFGVPSLLIQFENRRWSFPFREGSYNRPEMDVFLSELEAFGWKDGRLEGVGEHDDTVMCFWHLEWGIKKFVGVGS